MPPLNECTFDGPLLFKEKRISAIHSKSTTGISFQDPVLNFAFNPRRQKSVSFHDQVEVEYLPSRYDWSEEERISRWNSDDDYTHFQLDIFHTIYLLRNEPESIDDTSYSTRGIECRDPGATRRRRQVKKEAWNVVFERQKMKKHTWDEINECTYLVASMYCHATQSAMRSALDFAAQDEIEANNIQSEDNQLQNEEAEFFNPGWISLCPSSNSESSLPSNSDELSFDDSNDEEGFGFCVLGEESGFDNSWLREDV